MNEEMIHFLPDIPRVYTALAEWLACILCIMQTKRRISGIKLVGVSVGVLLFQGAFLALTKGQTSLVWIICMATAVLVMYGFIWGCCDMSARDAGYFCVMAFATAEFAASCEWQIDCFFYYDKGITNEWFKLVLLVSVYAVIYLVVWRIYAKYMPKDKYLDVTGRELVFCIIIGLSVFFVSNLSFIPMDTPFSGKYMREIFNLRTMVDLGGMAVLYAYHVQRMDFRVRHELESVESILHNQYVQYQQAREAMDLINYKYHDLKHHIIALRAEENAQKRNEYLNRMEDEIKSYEAQNKTGNKVLDTLLTSKNLYCMKHGISLTSVVDGTLFEFMDVMEICSIFGNAMDNAIECEKKIQDKEKRLIHVSAFSQKSFLIIRFENYCESELLFEEELPVTTKKETQFHGYGLKSLRYTVHKYGGEVDIDVEDNWFRLKILIPLNG